jgi:flavin-dependent dehydrogenase
LTATFSTSGQAKGGAKLDDGSRVAVIGGGPAGSLFSYFLLDLADRVGLQLIVDLYEPKNFSLKGPAGCNKCGGIISESLVQTLATDGIALPSSVVQRGIDAYVLHTDAGTVRIETPVNEKRIGAVHRGAGPLKASAGIWDSFDGFLLSLAISQGAVHIKERVTEIGWKGDRPTLETSSGEYRPYDLVAVAAGVNGQAQKLLQKLANGYKAPRVTKTIIREYDLGGDGVSAHFGDAMHLFLINLPKLKFAAVIPKGRGVTLCMLGEDINQSVLDSFYEWPGVRAALPEAKPQACACAPRMSISAAAQPFADRLVCIGDAGATRLYKDGIGAAYRTAKAAASTAVFKGISAEMFRRHFRPTCRSIEADNRFGRIIFRVTRLIQKSPLAQRAVLEMVRREQQSDSSRPMCSVLWDTFTGSAPYRDIFMRTLHPRFLANLLWRILQSAVCSLPMLGQTSRQVEAPQCEK